MIQQGANLSQNAFEAATALLMLTALLAWVNAKVFKLPGGVGMAFTGLLSSGLLVLSGVLHPELLEWARQFVSRFPFDELVFGALMPFLLFAGALHVDINAMRERKLAVMMLSTLGVLIGAGVFGFLFYVVSSLFSMNFSWGLCFLIGAMISPTDPIAALQMIKDVPLDTRVKAKIAGESLFNDAVGLLAFAFFLPFALQTQTTFSFGIVFNSLFVIIIQAILGVVLGAFIGFLSVSLMKSISDPVAETLLSIAAAALSWAISSRLSFSAPLAVVVCGLFIGVSAPETLSEKGSLRLFSFWTLADEILNSILFALMGVEVLLISGGFSTWFLAMAGIVCALLSRLMAVMGSLFVANPFGAFSSGFLKDTSILVWGGLRGALSIALALSLPMNLAHRDFAVASVYTICVFSIVVQGLTMKKWVCFLFKKEKKSSLNIPTTSLD